MWMDNQKLSVISELAEIAADDREFKKLSREHKNRITSILLEHQRSRKNNAFFTYYPETGPFRRGVYSLHVEHYNTGAHFDERVIFGGNRTGKTNTGAYESTAHLTGYYPDWWKGKRWDRPISAWVAGKTNRAVRDILQEKLFGAVRRGIGGKQYLVGTGMIPESSIDHHSAIFQPGVSGLIDQVRIRYRDSQVEFSDLGLKSYEQGPAGFEGTSREFVWYDEEPDLDIYMEGYMRTVDCGGIVVCTFTPNKGKSTMVMRFWDQDQIPEGLRETDYNLYD